MTAYGEPKRQLVSYTRLQRLSSTSEFYARPQKRKYRRHNADPMRRADGVSTIHVWIQHPLLIRIFCMHVCMRARRPTMRCAPLSIGVLKVDEHWCVVFRSEQGRFRRVTVCLFYLCVVVSTSDPGARTSHVTIHSAPQRSIQVLPSLDPRTAVRASLNPYASAGIFRYFRAVKGPLAPPRAE